ncbi:YitT family protein [Paenibacillus antri]|uniref:YitT family protein n=1 Tax=Paenibacillus antri TaxID=2582848 RepID=A0A5R9GFG1_9BACL|nr:YitT family protein [Paenibacillus antri]TLS53116.1 YitT family protein [Paenibacillus antri]
MRIQNGIKLAKQLFPIMLGTAIYAFGIHYFIVPNELTEGGVTGISILLNYAFGIPLSVSTLLLNIPLFIIGWKLLGRKGMLLTGFGTLSLTLFLYIMERVLHMGFIVPFATEDDLFLASLYAGVTLGAGLGIVFRFGGTTGGVDILARIVNRTKGWSIGQFFLYFDAIVISVSLLFISMERVLYTLVVVFVAAKIIDVIQQGEYAARAFTVISERTQDISKQIMLELDRGVTLIPAKGAFTGQPKEMLYCVVYRHETRRLERIVRQADPRAFIIVSEVQDVLGEGFKSEDPGSDK